MIGIQSQPQVNQSSNIQFTSKKPWEETRANFDDDESDSFNSSSVENNDSENDECDIKKKIQDEQDRKKDEINNTQKGWEDFADELEQSDNKAAKHMGKGARYIASAVGLAGTFIVSKYSSKLTIETLKSFGKSKTMESTVKTIKDAKSSLGKLWESAQKVAERPEIKTKIDAIKNSKAGKAVQEFFGNEKVKKVTEPIKNTIDSIKDSKINGDKVQSAVENTMAATATGSVIVDNLTGRNDKKSNIELATGS